MRNRFRLANVLLICTILVIPLSASTVSAASKRMMIIDGSNYAYSEDYPSITGWIPQISGVSTANAVAVGGSIGRMMVLWSNNGYTFAASKDNQYDSWSGQTGQSPTQAVAVGSSGEMMVIDSRGIAYAKLNPGDAWTPETGFGTRAIAVGGNGRLMVIDSCGTVYSKDNLTDTWLQQTRGGGGSAGCDISRAIAVGPTGEMMVIDSVGDAYAKMSPTDAWVQETNNNHSGSATRAIAVGGNGRLMVIDSAGNAWSKDSLNAVWTFQVMGAEAIAVGLSGRMMAIDSTGTAFYKDNPQDSWTPITSPGGAKAIAVN